MLASLIDHERIQPYWELMRFHRPIGILLLLWPTWWALWLAAEGIPDWDLLFIFTLGVILMRAAGCVINDIADRDIDGHVARTQQRPIAAGKISVKAALITFASLLSVAFILVLFTNGLTIILAVAAALLATIYPFMKRYTHLPQVVLGAAFSMAIPMAFAAQTNTLEPIIIIVYVTNLLWTVAYDTFYGMVDREYDKQLGVKSTAILFEGNDQLITGSLQCLTVIGGAIIGQRFDLGPIYFAGLLVAASLMIYQQWLITKRQPQAYFAAFLNNKWVGLAIFLGIALNYAIQ